MLVHILGAWAALFSKVGLVWCWGSRAGYASKWAPTGPVGAYSPLDHWQSPGSFRISAAKPSTVHPKDGGPSRPRELWIVTWCLWLLELGVPPPPPLNSLHLWPKVPSGHWQSLDLLRGVLLWVRSKKTRDLGYIFYHSPFSFTTQGEDFHKGSDYPRDGKWGWKNSSTLWTFSGTTTWKLVPWAIFYFQGL